MTLQQTTGLPGDGGAQNLMPHGQAVDGGTQRIGSKPSGQTGTVKQIARGGTWLELLEDPHPLLGEGKRHQSADTAPRNHSRCGSSLRIELSGTPPFEELCL